MIIDKINLLYEQTKNYLRESDLFVFIILAIIVIYFLTYLLSFFFQIPFILLLTVLIGYAFYKKKNLNIKLL